VKFEGATSEGATSTDLPNSVSSNHALELASNLRISVEMGDNFDHSADCSMGDWGLCHVQDLIVEYTGDEEYSNE